MTELPFSIERSIVGNVKTFIYAPDVCADLGEQLAAQVIQDIGIDLEVTVAGVTMFLAAWIDPEHWVGDWASKLGVERDEASAAVLAILTNAIA